MKCSTASSSSVISANSCSRQTNPVGRTQLEQEIKYGVEDVSARLFIETANERRCIAVVESIFCHIPAPPFASRADQSGGEAMRMCARAEAQQICQPQPQPQSIHRIGIDT
jgi:hypothetical protein